MFRNAMFFHIEGTPSHTTLADAIPERLARLPGPLEHWTTGFHAREDVGPSFEVNGCTAFTVVEHRRLLPQDVVRAAVQVEVLKIQAESGRPPGKRRRREIAEQVVSDLLPKAFVSARYVPAYVDHELDLLVVDTVVPKRGEMVAHELREALGSFPARPLCRAGVIMPVTEWLRSERVPKCFELGHTVQVRDTCERSSVIIGRGQDLDRDELRDALAGNAVTQLGLSVYGRSEFVLDADRVMLRQFKLDDLKLDDLNGLRSAIDYSDAESAAADEYEAQLQIYTGEIRHTLRLLDGELGILSGNR